MIKSSDLNSGNLIKVYDSLTGDENICTVTGKDQNEIIVKNSSGTLFGVNIIDIYGIEITPEILSRNGFKFDNVNRAYMENLKGCGILLEPLNEIINMNTSSEWLLIINSKIKIKFFHELQNLLLSKCGINVS